MALERAVRAKLMSKRDPDQEAEAQEWMELVLGKRFPKGELYEDVIRDGQILCADLVKLPRIFLDVCLRPLACDNDCPAARRRSPSSRLSRSEASCPGNQLAVAPPPNMSRQAAMRTTRLLAGRPAAATAAASRLCLGRVSCRTAVQAQAGLMSRRTFTATHARAKGIMPHTENPVKAEAVKSEPTYGVVELSENRYHELADAYLENVLAKFEHLQDSREDVDIEFSAGVMTITIADKGTYVINKQPPNKQIWLSSPISGPKRYDWCIIGESQGEKEGTGSNNWIYTRDGVSLNELIFNELGVEVGGPVSS